MNIKHKFRLLLFLFVFVFTTNAIWAQNSEKFIVTLDAGHGAHDPGAKYNGHTEKEITLAIVLKTGKILEKHSDIEVVYTRKTDVFIDLVERANIANRAGANIFVSIHCDAIARAEAYGSQSFVMGINKNASNLAVSKRENSVITLEKDYKKNYKGFDINNPETIIGATVLQEQYMDNSISLASKIQEKFTHDLGRKNRGVSPAPFMVLHKASMPRVLVETGFISNPSEGNYLGSEFGQNQIAQAIADAIISYKREYYGTNDDDFKEKPKYSKEEVKEITKPIKEEVVVPAKTDTVVPKAENIVKTDSLNETDGIIFKVQIMAANQKLDLKPKNFKGLKNVDMKYETGGLYKYTYGTTSDYQTAKMNLQEAKDKGFTTAYLIAFKDGKRIDIKDAIK
ncbi:MAG: N-acetylmuramoyl-L-alanine amidase [Flavobacterium sp.]|uniref:N-acetylmuramoyl-L-alanine amidase family protein n=1 Tax=Flavobacterium sp. TaxID=239 RepID=UPI0022C3E8F9|nr:N-acetylmuramoyl-L-alanine amidase [Flavobacterium sp.]MCZ8197521.1 N-acetylmuramoyl-L-alanine amidase [Flavobacterium sp.]